MLKLLHLWLLNIYFEKLGKVVKAENSVSNEPVEEEFGGIRELRLGSTTTVRG